MIYHKNSYDFIRNFNLNPIDCVCFIMLKSIALLCNGDSAVSVRLFLPFDRIISFSLFYENFRWINRIRLLTVCKCRKINGSRIYPRKRLKTALKSLATQRLYLYDPLPCSLLQANCTILPVNNAWYFNLKGKATLDYTRAREIPFYSMFVILYLKSWNGKYCVRSPPPVPCDPRWMAWRDPYYYMLDCSRFAFLIFPIW